MKQCVRAEGAIANIIFEDNMTDKDYTAKRRNDVCDDDQSGIKFRRVTDRIDGASQKFEMYGGLNQHRDDPSEENGNGKSLVDWMSLSKEVWSSIFHWIPAIDKVKSRLVSKEWKENVDSLSSFAIRLHGRLSRAKMEHYFGMRIHSIQVSSLQEPFEPNFQYPKYVKELIVATHVSPSVFLNLCQTFTEVQALRIVSTSKSDTTFDPKDKNSSHRALSRLKKLKEIDVTIHSFGTRGSWSCETFNVIFRSDISLPFAQLAIININMLMHHEEMEVFFKFLVNRREKLKCVTARIGCMASCFPVSFRRSEQAIFSTLPWFQELRTLKLRSLHIFSAPTCERCDLQNVWGELLRNQSSLIRLTSDHHELGVTDVFDVLRKNVHLRSCKVYNVNFSYNLEVEPLVFDSSCCLEELALEFFSNTVIICTISGSHSSYLPCFDFKNLPPSLRKLSIRGYNLPPNQRCSALQSLKNVEELDIGDCLSFDRTPASRLSSFKEICQILGSGDCSVRRIILDTFEGTYVSTAEQKVWTKIEKFGRDLGILSHCQDSNGCFRLHSALPFYDIQFTKEEIRQFLGYIDNMSDDDALCSTRVEAPDCVQDAPDGFS